MPSSSSIDPELMGPVVTQQRRIASATNLDDAAVVPSRPPTGRPKAKLSRPQDYVSFLRTQDEIDAICKKHGVPEEFTARPAGDLRADATPPPGAICVYARALEAGMRVPLDGFFAEALAHFRIAPAQLTPNGWRTMAGFLGLCRSLGVPPLLPVFRRFILLSIVSQRQRKGWYFCRSRKNKKRGLRFTGMPSSSLLSWKHEFFFLSSPEPWPCPVEWGEPPKSSFKNPLLTDDEKKWAAKLLRAHGGGAAVDLPKYLCNTNLTAALTTTALLPPPPSVARITYSPEGIDASVSETRRTMLAARAAAQQASAPAKKVRFKPGSQAAASPPLRRKKRSLYEANDKECLPPPMLNTALSSGVCSPPPCFSRKPQHLPSRHDGDGTNWVATREQLEEAKKELASAKREVEQRKANAELAATRAELAKAEAGLAAAEAEVVKAKAELIAAWLTAGAEQEKELAVEEAKAKLTAAKRALEEEVESAKATAVRQLLCCEEHVRRRTEHALEGYQRWQTARAPAGCTAWLAC